MEQHSADNDKHPHVAAAEQGGRLTTGTLEDLLKPEGLEIKQVDDPVVVLRPIPWIFHQVTRATMAADEETLQKDAGIDIDGGPVGVDSAPSGAFHPLFESSEHVISAMDCYLKFPSNSTPGVSALRYKFTLDNGLQLTYGQIIALAGDFYGDPDHPVCKATGQNAQVQQFITNYQSLARDTLATQQVPKILNILHKEFSEITKAISSGKQPSGAYGMLGDDLSQQWDQATNGRYLELAKKNFDHFGQDAILCYSIGHYCAQMAASQASDEKGLAKAYSINAFADHFLTDLFSAGHLRTPRRRMYEDEVGIPGSVSVGGHSFSYPDAASLLARCMHDEDSHYGLWVTNQRGDSWVAFGDKRYRDRSNYPNRVVIRAALQQSMDEIWISYSSKQVPPPGTSPVFSYIPSLNVDWTNRKNYSPLFWLNPSENAVWRRNDVTNRSDYSWLYGGGVLGWWVWSTVALLWKDGMVTVGFESGNPGATGIIGNPPAGLTGSMTGPDLTGLTGAWTTIGPGGPTGMNQ